MSKAQRQSATLRDGSIICQRASWAICCPIHIDESDGDPPDVSKPTLKCSGRRMTDSQYPDHPNPPKPQPSTESEGAGNEGQQETTKKTH